MNKPTFNLDMDGVVADWTAGAANIVGYRIDNPNQLYPEADWHKIRNHKHMFRELPLMRGAHELVKIARRFRDELGYELVFLTAIPHYNDVRWAFWDKMLWAQSNFPDIPVHFGPYSKDKQTHCIPGDILVDDRTDNCEEWVAKGGVAVNVKPNKVADATVELESMLNKKLSLSRLSDYV